ncbi:MAG: DUF6320 domain-containing protein [Ruminococcus flavefaciens]|nr:DUF6320 domain-containing protein [Ruminococcus flavefaciens]MCM1230315.1 DUF6320 domain-containing protein [Ruminococcus flavefaciens]
MAYCVKCGVKLEDSEKQCPLCRTAVYHPDIKIPDSAVQPYPEEHIILLREMNNKYKIIIATICIFIPAILTFICDYKINSEIIWADIVFSSVCFLYSLIFIPMIFTKKDVLVYLGADFSALLLFMWYMSFTLGQNWFLPFAMPLILSAVLITFSAILIKRFVNKSYLFVFAVVFILTGADCILIEFLINKVFFDRIDFIWSFYPCLTFMAVGVVLMLINRNKKLKEQMTKRFFV